MAGKAIASSIVEAAAVISPYEDVRGYLQQTLLPVLSPSIEELLHHVHATGELQRVLREKAESERRAVRRISENDPEAVAQALKAEAAREAARRTSKTTPPAAGGSPTPATAGSAGAEKDQDPGGKERVRRPSISSTGNSATGDAEKMSARDGKAKDAIEEPSFDPLFWLSENIRKASQGETSQYRETITERVIQQIKAMEAAEEAERLKAEAEAAAALLAEQGMAALPEGSEVAG